MKKVIWLLVMLSVCSISYAESMKFITVLSSPVGTFNKLEAVDPEKSAHGGTVNFCTSIGTEGKVELKGTNPATLDKIVLADTTTLGRTGKGKYSLTEIKLKQGGNIKGGRLFGNTFSVNNAASGKADNLYGNELTVAGAKTKSLEITGASQITAQHEAADMVWSNEYQDDDACKSGSACAKQYLLKQKGSVCQPTDPRGATYTENCPSGQTGSITYTWNYNTCRYDKEDTCYSGPSCEWKFQREVTFSFTYCGAGIMSPLLCRGCAEARNCVQGTLVGSFAPQSACGSYFDKNAFFQNFGYPSKPQSAYCDKRIFDIQEYGDRTEGYIFDGTLRLWPESEANSCDDPARVRATMELWKCVCWE